MSLSNEEIKSVEYLLSFLGKHPVIVDVGSNKGEWSDIILNEFKENCTVHFFEPNDILLNYCRIKYDYNTNIIFNSKAVYSKSNEVMKFYYFENYNNGLSTLIEHKEGWENLPVKEKQVETISIDDYCEQNNIDKIDFLKIDVEGADPYVLQGAIKMLIADKIKIIQIEYGSHYLQSHFTFHYIIEKYSILGYKFYSFNGKDFDEITKENFVEDYRLENFIITKYLINNLYNCDNVFIENTKDLSKFELIIEVGVAEGMTTKYMCENMLENGGRVIAIDPLNDWYVWENDIDSFRNQYERFLRNTKGLPIDLMREKSEIALPKLHALRAQFIYIDGDHSEDAVYNDAIKSFDITKIEGYILFDDYSEDYDYGKTRKGIKRFLERNKGCYEIVHENYQLLIRKTSDY